MCVCVCEREKKRGRESVCVCVREKKRGRESVCVCVREKERERECVYTHRGMALSQQYSEAMVTGSRIRDDPNRNPGTILTLQKALRVPFKTATTGEEQGGIGVFVCYDDPILIYTVYIYCIYNHV